MDFTVTYVFFCYHCSLVSNTKASQWIHQSYVNNPQQQRDHSPSSVRSMQALAYPGFSEYDRDFGWHTESRVFSPKKSGTNAFGTWSGRNFDPDFLETGTGSTGKGKKGKKWYKFNFTKKSTRKSKDGSENRGYKSDSDYVSSTMPFIKAVDGDKYASLSRRRFKSETDIKGDYQLNEDDLHNDLQGSSLLVPSFFNLI